MVSLSLFRTSSWVADRIALAVPNLIKSSGSGFFRETSQPRGVGYVYFRQVIVEITGYWF